MNKPIYILVVALLTVLSSCTEDVLNKKPMHIISDGDVWNDPTLIQAYLVECYAQTYVFNNVNRDNTWDNLWWGDAGTASMWLSNISDECRSGWVSLDFAWWYKHGLLTIEGGLMEWWDDAYSVIRKLNILLEKVPDSPLTEEEKVSFVAEARFIRAFNYFEMVKRYGGVPLVLVPMPADIPEESFPARAAEADVYDFILSELDDLSTLLPEAPDDLGRPSKWAALALKSRAALYAGSIARYGTVQLEGVVGIDAADAESYFQESYDASSEMMTNGPHALYDADADKVENFINLFMDGDHPEKIFLKRHGPENGMGGHGTGWGWDFFNAPPPNGWGAGRFNNPYLEMVEEFEYVDGTPGTLDRDAIQQGVWSIADLFPNKDPRFYASVYTQDDEWQDDILDFHIGIMKPDGEIVDEGSFFGVLAKGKNLGEGGFTGFGVRKYLDESHNNLIGLNGDWATSSTDWMVFRYAEVLLNHAEAAYELGNSGDALTAINAIRERAGIALLGDVSMDAIRHERKIELAFEGHRYWDLRRWRVAVDLLSQNNSGLRYIFDFSSKDYILYIIENMDGVVNPPVFHEKNYYLPVTIRRTGMNQNLVENPGY